ncbi:hypothetical protein [Flavobacterium sp.]|uniref:hypothetical protein n=1 Tax=Flavobacterium sp. TaxID=239 RepID=UPI0033411CFC
MKKAIEGKFYLEAITIQESIITDRLLSFVIRKEILVVSNENFHSQNVSLNNLSKLSRVHFEDETLFNEIDEFRLSRNKCIHAMVKSFPGNPTQKVSEFQKLSRETSLIGRVLTRKVDAWHTRMKKTHNI